MENIAYEIAQLMLSPVLICIYVMFIYSIIETGRMLALAWMRFNGSLTGADNNSHRGFPVMSFYRTQATVSMNDVEVFALKKLETVKIVTRLTPMLGLIATLIPMGPALVALQENNTYAMSEHMATAFTAVTISLLAASLTFWVASVKKRWFAEELVTIEKLLGTN